jgi:hypothetical protein
MIVKMTKRQNRVKSEIFLAHERYWNYLIDKHRWSSYQTHEE